MSDQTTAAPPADDAILTLGIEGTWNSRDVASLTGLRPGVVLRSAALHSLTDAGLARLVELGVSDVVDLRSPAEIARDGEDRVPEGVTLHSLPIVAGGQVAAVAATAGQQDPAEVMKAAMAAFGQLLQSGDTAEIAASFMADTYAAIVTDPDAVATIGGALRVVARAEGAVLVHCAAGKDRTGIVVATLALLAAAGTPEVEADFLYSNHAADQQGSVAAIPGIDPALLAPLREVSLRSLDAARTAALEAYGDLDGFVRAAGLPEADRERIAERLGVAAPGSAR